jgi:hypothetical protein
MLPDIRGRTADELRRIPPTMLRALCHASGAPVNCLGSSSKVETMVAWLESNVSGPEARWTHQMLLENFARLQRRAWTEFSTLQNEVHRDLWQKMRIIQSDDADVAASCAAAGDSEDAADAAGPVFNDLADLADSPFFEKILSIVDHEMDGLVHRIEDEAVDLAMLALPISATEQVEMFFASLQGQVDGVEAGLQNALEVQRLPWFPAYILCLLDPAWPIPGFSPWWSARIKAFLQVSY